MLQKQEKKTFVLIAQKIDLYKNLYAKESNLLPAVMLNQYHENFIKYNYLLD